MPRDPDARQLPTKNSGLSRIFAVKCKLRQIFRRAQAPRSRERFTKTAGLAAEKGARLDLARGNEVGGRDFFAIAELGLAGVDPAALGGNHQAAVGRLDYLADLALDRA